MHLDEEIFWKKNMTKICTYWTSLEGVELLSVFEVPEVVVPEIVEFCEVPLEVELDVDWSLFSLDWTDASVCMHSQEVEDGSKSIATEAVSDETRGIVSEVINSEVLSDETASPDADSVLLGMKSVIDVDHIL